MYKLCGGTLFVLLLHSSKTKNETNFLCDILRIFDPKIYINSSNVKIKKDKFKRCKEHSELATTFEDSSMQIKLNNDISNHYAELLKRTSDLITNYIDNDSDLHKEELLVKAVIEVIEQDESIANNQMFYILPNGKAVTKEKLISIKKIYFPSFLLGILYYVIINIKDNKEGANTYDEWCPKPDYGTQRKYTANIGEKSKKQVVLVNTPDEYDYYELLDLAGELIKFYIKRIPFNDGYDIGTTTIIVKDNIDESEKNNYLEFCTVSYDYKIINDFVNNCNKLIYSVENHQSNNEKTEYLIGSVKSDFYDKWLSNPHKFTDDAIQTWFDFILDKIYNSKIIDINNITTVAKLINPDPSAWEKMISSPKFPRPQIRHIVIKEEQNTTRSECNNVTENE